MGVDIQPPFCYLYPMNEQLATTIVGGLSLPSKMPCRGYSISALRCITGAKLRKVENSVCAKCYALRGNYRFSNVQDALERRYASLSNPQWVEAMTWLITNIEASGYFRWHDSGDIQSIEHLEKIVAVCKATPAVKHWLPPANIAGMKENRVSFSNTLPSIRCFRPI